MGTHQQDVARKFSNARANRIHEGTLTDDGTRPSKASLHRPPQQVAMDVVKQHSPTAARGFVCYIRIRPDRPHREWLCDECCKIVAPSHFMTHAEDNH